MLTIDIVKEYDVTVETSCGREFEVTSETGLYEETVVIKLEDSLEEIIDDYFSENSIDLSWELILEHQETFAKFLNGDLIIRDREEA